MSESETPPPLPPQLQNQPHAQAAPQALGDNAGIRLLLPVGRSGWAIAAGYLGLFALIIVPAPLALIVSIIAIFDLKKPTKTGAKKRGWGRAIFGLLTGLAGTAILAYFLIDRI